VIARVEPIVTSRAVRGPFDYRLSERVGGVEVGSLLVVPFGPRRLLGVVVGLADSSELPPEKLAEPVCALEAGAPASLVRLAQRVALECCTTPARALELVLPPGTRRSGHAAGPRRRTMVRATAGASGDAGADRQLGRRQAAVLEALAEGERAAAELPGDRGVLRRLAERGLVEIRDVEEPRRPSILPVGARDRSVELTAAQAGAVSVIEEALDGDRGGGGGGLLLHGVTGSGKTEVYLAATRAALERDRGAIVLVPEIGLTPQTVARFGSRFGDSVALLHSRMAEGERRDEWMRLRRGRARVAVGPRSAVFAPVDDLGLIVVDEEHEASYKQEGEPRYDAREVARWRADQEGAVLLCGSATPRPESWERLERLELPDRVDGGAMPEVEVLDMRGRDPGRGPLHERARGALAELGRSGGKAIVLLNRRGWAPHLGCRSCGHGWECPHCAVSLVVHRHEGNLRCHHCGHAERIPEACPDCDSVALARHGAGTERLEPLLEELVAPLPVFRLDSDSAAREGGHLEVLRRFEAAEGGLLLGTQIVAKGHDFPDVVLSVAVDADASLRFPDFRAEERTFALVSQLAGRSGRGERGGRVLVQTLAPHAEAIRRAARHDAPAFLRGELERRRALRYPPFSVLIRVELAGGDEPSVEAAAERLATRLAGAVPPGADLLGPAPRFRLRGRHRRQVLLKAAVGERGAAVSAVREAVEQAAARRELREVALSVDVDPQ
jgi:primosomal protein N' (replication factor Y) (superfamily II helicase)